jgi:hypothetical protein
MVKHFLSKISMVVLVLMSFVSCSRNKQLNAKYDYSLSKTEFSIEHDGQLITNRFKYTKLIGEDSLIYFEQKDRLFYLFDLKNKVLKTFLQFDTEGPNFIESQILGFDRVGDYFAILSSNYISISDIHGQVIKRKNINKLQNNWNDSNVSRVHHLATKNENELYLAQSPRAVLAPFQYDGNNPPIFAIYHIAEDSLSYLPINSPDETLIKDDSKGYYGSDAEHFFTLNKESIIFNFEFSPSVYRYSLDNKELTRFEGKTTIFSEVAEPFPANRHRDPEYLVKRKMLSGTKFSNIVYDQVNEVYIRFASHKIYNEESRRSKNRVYLQLFDKAFKNVLEEELLPPGKAEVYFQNGSIYMIGVGNFQSEENATKFIKYDIHKN